MQLRRITPRFALATSMLVLLLAMAGCVDRDVKGDEVTYDFSWWVPTTAFLSALIAFPAGLVLRKRSGRIGWALIVIAPVLAIVVFPAMILDKVKIDSQHFETHYGLWFAPNKHNIRFDDLHEIRLVTYEARGRRGRKRTKQRMECVPKSGAAVTRVELGDLVKRAAPEILERAEAKGVTITSVGP